LHGNIDRSNHLRDDIVVHRSPGSCAIQVDNMHSRRAGRGKAHNDIDGVIGNLLPGLEVAFAKTNGLPTH
jgi:hypothetical protein